MTALEFLKHTKLQLSCVPMHLNGNKPIEASNGQMRRWLDMGAVRINGLTPKWDSDVEFPIWELLFFPSSKNKVSIHYSEQDKEYSERMDAMEAVYLSVIGEQNG